VSREIKELASGHGPVRRRKKERRLAPVPEVPPLRPATLEPVWSRGRLILPRNSTETHGDSVMLATALKLVRAELHALADDAARSGTIDERSIVCLRSVAARIPGYAPAQDELFYLAHVKGFLEGSARAIRDAWPGVLAAQFDEVTLHFDHTARQFPKWCEFVSNAEEVSLSSEELAELPGLAAMMIAALREGEARNLVDPAIPLALEVFHAPLEGGIKRAEQQSPGPMEASKWLLVNDLLESIENIAKRTAEAALEIEDTGPANGKTESANAALSWGETDRGEAHDWMTRILLGTVTTAPIVALRPKFYWLEAIVGLFGRS
jgi:hypothetical protein